LDLFEVLDVVDVHPILAGGSGCTRATAGGCRSHPDDGLVRHGPNQADANATEDAPAFERRRGVCGGGVAMCVGTRAVTVVILAAAMVLSLAGGGESVGMIRTAVQVDVDIPGFPKPGPKRGWKPDKPCEAHSVWLGDVHLEQPIGVTHERFTDCCMVLLLPRHKGGFGARLARR
jgi:hypothetical protein